MASLVADYGESSGVSSDESEPENFQEKEEQSTNERLPPPAFTDKIKNSVFVNPFLEAENAKFAVLEKHVKMVPQSNGKEHKRICWMFKKGKCHFGKKCKFLHQDENASSLLTTPPAGLAEAKTGNFTQNRPPVAVNDEANSNERLSDEEEPVKKRKRPGLTQGLVPGKRVMAIYRKQKEFSN